MFFATEICIWLRPCFYIQRLPIFSRKTVKNSSKIDKNRIMGQFLIKLFFKRIIIIIFIKFFKVATVDLQKIRNSKKFGMQKYKQNV